MARSASRPLSATLAASLALGSAWALSAGFVIGGAAPAVADPAPAPTNFSQTTPGAFTGTVPNGVCAVNVAALGAAGGSAIAAPNTNGSGARVLATYPVVPGQSYSGTVGGGGQVGLTSGTDEQRRAGGLGGSNGGGQGGTMTGGTTFHVGAGGGGYTDVTVGGVLVVLAGAGGASGGGHSTDTGLGGNAGLPTAAGVTTGSNGTDGIDSGANGVAGGGKGGQATGPGAGGLHATNNSADGFAGVGRTGGQGGFDPTPDSAGGGGGGYYGGGGGASTIGNGGGGATSGGIGGAGGGGGASYVNPLTPTGAGAPTAISSSAGAKTASSGVGANGSVSLSWVTCGYDLGITKSASPTTVAPNATVTYTLAVTNNGPSAMTRGDLVSITDANAVGGTVTGVQTSGGSDPLLARTPFTCTPGTGGTIPAGGLSCSRPYSSSAPGSATTGQRGLDVGETLTLTYTRTYATPGTKPNTAAVTDRNGITTNNSASASVTVAAPPTASPDSRENLVVNTPTTVPVLANDSAGLLGSSVVINGAPGDGKTLEVPGEGTWTVNPTSGAITFTPLGTFTGDPTPIGYTATDGVGQTATSTVTLDYVQSAVNDVDPDNTIGDPVTVDVLANDTGNFDPTTVVIVGGTDGGKTLVVPDVGTWTVNPTTGAITFTPAGGFEGDPEPISYRVTDRGGDVVGATVTVDYLPQAEDDQDLANTIGDDVTVDVLANDSGDLDPATVTIVGAPGDGKTLEVSGVGTWTVNATTGAITFDPVDGFEGNPDPVTYSVRDRSGDAVTATVTVTYLPAASDDQDLDNTVGDDVTVDVLANDTGDLDPTSVRIVGAPGDGKTLEVPGVGTWTVNATTGAITFAPLGGYEGDPAPINYSVAGNGGQRVQAEVTVTYVQSASNDVDPDNTIGDDVTVDVLANDTGNFDPTTVVIVGGTDGGKTLVVPDVGTWTVNPTTGAITFTPAGGFEGDPEPISYRVTDRGGDVVGATVTVDYLPTAEPDRSDGNAISSNATVNPLTNDHGDLDPTTVVIVGATGDGKTLVVLGEGTWTVDPATGVITFDPEPGFEGSPAPIDYRVNDRSGDETGSTVTVTYLPVAADDEDLGNTIGDVVTLDVLAHDSGALDPTSVVIVGAPGDGKRLVVLGEGTWTVSPTTGAITFTPEPGFVSDPTDIEYEVSDTLGQAAIASVNVEYLPAAVDDEDLGNTIGDAVTLDVLANDRGLFDATSVVIVGAPGDGKTLVVLGEGTWTVNPTTGAITFTPEPGFLTDPTDISYRVTDTTGDVTGADVNVEYVPVAADDEDLGNTIGDAVTLDVLGNDTGDFDATSVVIVGAPGNGKTLVVAGEGTWTVNPTTGAITFTPAAGFTGNPTPITYQVTDTTGDVVSADVRVTYTPVASNDVKRGNQPGQPVTVCPICNDSDNLDPTSVRIIDPATGQPVTRLVVPGEGVWTVDPATGEITFTPAAGFTGNPTPVRYQAADADGNLVGALVVITYLPTATDDEDLDNAPGTAVTVCVVCNDADNVDPTTVRIIDPRTGRPVTRLVVPGQGVWTVNTTTGTITFTPEAGFDGDPTPIDYQVADADGNLVRATVTVTYGDAPVVPTPPAEPQPPLAWTGAQIGGAAGLGALLLGLGATFIVISRRRREDDQTA